MKKFSIGKTYKRFSSTGKLLYTVKVQNRIDYCSGTPLIQYTITKHFTTADKPEDTLNQPIHCTDNVFYTSKSEVLFNDTYHVIIHPLDCDTTSHIKYRKYLYKLCTNAEFFKAEIKHFKEYAIQTNIKFILIDSVLVSCNKMIDYNFTDITCADALIMILSGLNKLINELKITESININETYIHKLSPNDRITSPTLPHLVIVSILYGRYNTYFKPQVNEFIQKVIYEYCNHWPWIQFIRRSHYKTQTW